MAKRESKIISPLIKVRYLPAVQNTLATVSVALVPPPYKRNDMELMHGAWAGTSTVRCKDGRPIGEDNAYPTLYRKSVDTRYQTGHFGDSRDGKQYNMTALHHMMKDWDEIMAVLSVIRSYYVERFGIEKQGLSTIDLYVFAKLGVAITAYLIRHQKIAVTDGSVPPVLSSQTKLITGVFMIVRKMIERGEEFLNDEEIADADFLYEYSDKHGLLISPRDANFACAGSIRKIKELIHGIIHGPVVKKDHSARLKHHFDLIGDLSVAFDYGILDLQMELVYEYAQVELIHLALEADEDSACSTKAAPGESVDHIRKQFPEDFQDCTNHENHRRHIRNILQKLGAKPVEIMYAQHDAPLTLSEIHNHYLNRLREYSVRQQNRINELIGLQPINAISLDKIAKRLNVISKRRLIPRAR